MSKAIEAGSFMGKNTRVWVRKHTHTYSLSQWKTRWFRALWQQHLHEHVTAKSFGFSTLYMFLSATPIKQVKKHLHKLIRSSRAQHVWWNMSDHIQESLKVFSELKINQRAEQSPKYRTGHLGFFPGYFGLKGVRNHALLSGSVWIFSLAQIVDELR